MAENRSANPLLAIERCSNTALGVSLTPGKLSAVRAAFKAGVRPLKIAKQFGVSQSDVRKVLAGEAGLKRTVSLD